MKPGIPCCDSCSNESSVEKTSKKSLLTEKSKTFAIKETFPGKVNTRRASLIPKLKINNSETKDTEGKLLKPAKFSKITSAINQSKSKFSTSQEKFSDLKKPKRSDASCEGSQNKQVSQSQPTTKKSSVRDPDSIRRMISDPQMFINNIPVEGKVLYNFENIVRQISEVWLKTSADLSNTLKTLKNNPSLDPRQFQRESFKIQMAIQQAKSLTVLKTTSVMAEAKILTHNMTEQGFFLPIEALTPEYGDDSQAHPVEERKSGGMGDLPKQKSNKYFNEIADDDFENSSGSLTTRIEKAESFLHRKNDKTSSGQKNPENPEEFTAIGKVSQELINELSKKNETITQLNNKVFQLQKKCEEQVQLRNYLRIKITEYHEEIQWNHVLWKQIGKLKARIKEYQESYENLEKEKNALETRTAVLEKEIEKMKKFQNQKNFSEENMRTGRRGGDAECRKEVDKLMDKNILEEKQNSINVLKMVLSMMTDQENLAQKQIAKFQSKIEELERASKR